MLHCRCQAELNNLTRRWFKTLVRNQFVQRVFFSFYICQSGSEVMFLPLGRAAVPDDGSGRGKRQCLPASETSEQSESPTSGMSEFYPTLFTLPI